MCYAGAESTTAEQLKQLLNFDSFDNNQHLFASIQTYLSMLSCKINGQHKIILNTANKIYPKLGFHLNQTYVNTIESSFSSQIQQLDYSKPNESAQIINDWVSEQTKEKIKNLIHPNIINASTELILVNCVYFKAKWYNQFVKYQTKDDYFYNDDGTKMKCNMMIMNNRKFEIQIKPLGLDINVCHLPYRGKDVLMCIILPNKEKHLSDIEKQLNEDLLENILNKNDRKYKKLNLHLPKFKLEYKNEISKRLALKAPFAFDSRAEFSGITGDKNSLFISKCIHQSFIEVDEEGTEAAAATAISVSRSRSSEPLFDFICNRPFLFFIYENISKSILFIGKLNQTTFINDDSQIRYNHHSRSRQSSKSRRYYRYNDDYDQNYKKRSRRSRSRSFHRR